MPASSDPTPAPATGAPHPAPPGGGALDAERRRAMLRYAERFAVALTEIGLPRMAARVFAYVLCDDAERYTAAELATALQVSPAAISGAVRTLTQMRLLGREREPGARVDTYRVYDDDLWGTITSQRVHLMTPFIDLAAEGVALLGADTPGGRRLRETEEYFHFFKRKLAEFTDEWHEHKRKLFDGEVRDSDGADRAPERR